MNGTIKSYNDREDDVTEVSILTAAGDVRIVEIPSADIAAIKAIAFNEHGAADIIGHNVELPDDDGPLDGAVAADLEPEHYHPMREDQPYGRAYSHRHPMRERFPSPDGSHFANHSHAGCGEGCEHGHLAVRA